MQNRYNKSLSGKIIFSTALMSVLILFIIFFVFEKISKTALMDVEKEKANLIAQTVEPFIALDIYLDLDGKIDQIVKQLIQNPNILAVRIFKKGKILKEAKSSRYKNNWANSFLIVRDIHKPNTGEKIGKLEILYSSTHYNELVSKYTYVILGLSGILAFIFILFSMQVQKYLYPLRDIATRLKNYSPKKGIIKLPYENENNEIGLISNTVNEMQKRIDEYSKLQKRVNKTLEEKVKEKT
ncbi:hypothetical protein [Nitrosophilus alvini]|uniref:hypothetical protein n=1 Tax=Nitrosophilus alvini TaxID=2714855 RepID=UPI00190CD740|nr:hypothetical protein [Nitrosophilus alvini]